MKNLYFYLKKQLFLIKEGGSTILKLKIKKLIRTLTYFLYILLIFPFYIGPLLLIRILNPFKIIRIGYLESQGIGHFSLPIETYLCEIDCGLINTSNCIDLWYLDKIVCNDLLLNKWKKYFKIYPRFILKPIDDLNLLLPGGRKNRVPFRYLNENTPWHNVDINNVLIKTSPHITFTDLEIAHIENSFKKLNINFEDQIICFMIRDSAYYNHIKTYEDFRNSNLDLYIEAMEILSKNNKIFRLGAKVNCKLNLNNNNIIDYATNGMRTELLDLFLIYQCRFMVSTGTGIDALAPLFRKPLLYVNHPQFGFVDELSDNVMFIPKFYFSNKLNRIMTFKEIFDLKAHLFTQNWQFDIHNIKVIDNSNDDIKDAVMEMDQRLKGKWVLNENDNFLYNKFINLWPVRKNSQIIKARICVSFLRKHTGMLD